MANTNLIISLIGLLLALVSIVFGILIAARSSGKFKISLIFLVVSIVVFVIHEAGLILSITGSAIGTNNFTNIIKSENFDSVIHIIIILLIFSSLFSMKKMINDIDSRY